jgi:hypothetical protein
MWLPEQQIGAVILTSADNAVFIRGPLQRRPLEMLFDGRIAAACVTSSAATICPTENRFFYMQILRSDFAED